MARTIGNNYALAKEIYAQQGVDTDAALKKLATIPISMHCWQGDDVVGFEDVQGSGGGIMATGNYPGRARTGDELRTDAEKAFSLIPGKHRFNLHAKYAEQRGTRVDRDNLDFPHFSRWIDWAKELEIGLDFNPTFFAHPKADSGFTLSSADESIRKFWVNHGVACRNIAAAIGRELSNPCVHNLWIPDGYKDVPADRAAPRARLLRSLDEIYRADISEKECVDALEGKLFGLGSESYVTGSFEFYFGYAVKNRKTLTLDSGHFHPTEQIADKLSAVFCSLDRVLLHVSRGVRWDSDHVTIFSDDLRDMMVELVRGNYLSRTYIATDYFDASINRIAAWVVGMRCVQKALLYALCEPHAKIRECENSGDFTSRLALLEETKTLPLGAVWECFCEQNGAPAGNAWLDEVKKYEKNVLMGRG